MKDCTILESPLSIVLPSYFLEVSVLKMADEKTEQEKKMQRKENGK